MAAESEKQPTAIGFTSSELPVWFWILAAIVGIAVAWAIFGDDK